MQRSRITIKAGDTLFFEGDAGDEAYIIERGQIAITSFVEGIDHQYAVLGSGDLVGEMALIDQGMRTATATALAETSLIVIPRAYMQRLMDSADPTFTLILKVILERFRSLKERHDLLSQGIIPKPLHDFSAPSSSALVLQTTAAAERIAKEQALWQALQKGELRLFFQPIVDLRTGQIAGCESLIRWLDPVQGMRYPDEFIPLAEESGLIEEIGHQVFIQAHQAAEILRPLAADPQRFFVSVNLSSKQIQSDAQVDKLFDLIFDQGIDLSRLKLEITESLLMSDPVRVVEILNNFKHLGCSIALDDFGTGYSSFSYLHRFPIDNIKIDRSFVATMRANKKSDAIVRSLCSLARAIDISVIAEGIEEVADQQHLEDMSCDFGQGYLYARPLPLEQFVELLTQEASHHYG